MKLPVGKVVRQALNLRDFDYKAELLGFSDSRFSGYLINTIDGFDGIEEGILLFREGELIAALYEYTKYAVTFFGDSALSQVFNSLVAPYGVVDVCTLTNQQVDLVIAFNDKVKLRSGIGKKDMPKNFSNRFSSSYAEKALSEILKKYESRKSVLKRIGLSELGG